MKYCPECAVAIKSETETCPLCGSDLQDKRPGLPADVLPQFPENYESLAARVRRRPWIIGMVTLGVLIIPGAITVIVDLLINGSLSWSLIVTGALMLLFLYISLPSMVFFLNSPPEDKRQRRIRRRKRFWILMVLNSLATWGYLMYLDRVDADGALNWAPVTGSLLTLLTLLVVMLFFHTLQPPGAVRRASLLFLWSSLYMICVDFVLSHFLLDGQWFGWSLIVSASLIPLGIVYWIINYLVEHSEGAKRRLHL